VMRTSVELVGKGRLPTRPGNGKSADCVVMGGTEEQRAQYGSHQVLSTRLVLVLWIGQARAQILSATEDSNWPVACEVDLQKPPPHLPTVVAAALC